MAKDKVAPKTPLIAIDTPGAVVGLIVAIVIAFAGIAAVVSALNSRNDNSAPDCSQGPEEGCN
jgi:hypothetical protein